MVCASSDWEHGDIDIFPSSLQSVSNAVDQDKDLASIEFDSQDEDECEDLFAGIWSPALASRRRQGKTFRKNGPD